MSKIYGKKEEEPYSMFLSGYKEGPFTPWWWIINTIIISLYTVMAFGVLYRGCGLDKIK